MIQVRDELTELQKGFALNIPQSIDHDKMINMYQVVKQLNCSYMIMDFASKHNLFNYIAKGHLSEKVSVYYFNQLVDALIHLSRNNYAHRDLKPENCLIDGDLNMRLADFGFCTTIENNQSRLHYTKRGTISYMAPEILDDHICSKKGYDPELSDVFSAGVVLFSAYMGRPPFRKADAVIDQLYQMFATEPDQEYWDLWDNQWAQQSGINLSPQFIELVRAMMHREAS